MGGWGGGGKGGGTREKSGRNEKSTENGCYLFSEARELGVRVPVAGAEEGRRTRGGGREEWILRSRRVAESEQRAGPVVPLKSTWELLLPIWDVEERPEAMQHEATVNAMTLDNVFAYKLHWEQQSKKEGKGEGSFGRDKKLQVRKYLEEEDNCGEKLHAVRFERGPMVEEDKFWDRVPLRRKETFRHLPLERDGAEGAINENVITRAHDRALPLRLRMFAKGNYTKKGFAASAESREPAADWEAPKGVLAVQEALCNLGDVYHKLWPLDNTPRRLWRVLIRYNYAAKWGSSEKERCALLEEFCDRVLRENSSRAARDKEPLTYRQAKERWKDCTEEFGSGDGGGQYRREDGKREEKKQGKSGGGGKAQAGQADGLRRLADGDGNKTTRFQGNLVCFHYNNRNTTCTRKPEGDGCDNGRGGVYAHVCNFQLGGGKFCFGKHKRHEKH